MFILVALKTILQTLLKQKNQLMRTITTLAIMLGIIAVTSAVQDQ